MIPRRVTTTRQADADIEGAIDHYLNQGAIDAASAFVDALEDDKALLSEHPHLGSSHFAVELSMPGMP